MNELPAMLMILSAVFLLFGWWFVAGLAFGLALVILMERR